MKTANTNSPGAYIREGLLSEGYLRLSFGALFQEDLFIYLFIYFFFGGGGGLLSEFYGSLMTTRKAFSNS